MYNLLPFIIGKNWQISRKEKKKWLMFEERGRAGIKREKKLNVP